MITPADAGTKIYIREMSGVEKTGIRSWIMLQRGTDNGLQIGGFDRSVQVRKREIAAAHS